MNESTKSLIRHALTAIGVLVTLLGLNKFIPVIEFITLNLDAVWSAITVLIGFVTALFGFMKEKARFKKRTEA